MASSKHAGICTDAFVCPVCLELLNNPVILDCGHNYCKDCIDRVWDSQKQPFCLECGEKFLVKKCTVNGLLANAIQMVQANHQKVEELDPRQKNSDHLCTKHEKRLELFCEDDESLSCVLCIPEHQGHKFLPVQNAFSKNKDNLTALLPLLQSSLKHFKEIKCQQKMKISEVTDNARSLQLHIASEFAKLHQFLQEKEEKLVQQLKEEETGILRQIEENLRKIKENVNAAQESVFLIRLQLQEQDPLNFLKKIKSLPERIKKCHNLSDKQGIMASDLCVGAYKGPLQYGVWKEMKSILNPGLSNLSLDPNTAHPKLVLSEEMTSVSHGDIRQQLHDNYERFNNCVSLLGSERFESGRHYWEVDVGNKTDWDVGVTVEFINRKGEINLSPEAGYWVLCMRNGSEYVAMDSPPKDLSLSVKPQRIGVYLDYEGGQVAFYNAHNMSHIYTFNDTFTDRLCTYFSPFLNNAGKNGEPLKIFHLKL
ncbi:zinc-binding protein A33-like [Protopterus annectens]|uniref:zinc-binding protein A33-like n=1 Tax=Protopterus annectens TaxID=7888 RepID=UPI001CFA8EAD|nr:zinc-binding protein A33-like [Protopterus annectens]